MKKFISGVMVVMLCIYMCTISAFATEMTKTDSETWTAKVGSEEMTKEPTSVEVETTEEMTEEFTEAESVEESEEETTEAESVGKSERKTTEAESVEESEEETTEAESVEESEEETTEAESVEESEEESSEESTELESTEESTETEFYDSGAALDGAKVDIVFLIDNTGSMGSAISNVKNNLNRFISSLSEAGMSYRIAVAEYGDITVWGEEDSTNVLSYGGTQWFTTTENVSRVLNQIVIQGGGDRPETLLDGIGCVLSSQLQYREDASKFIIALTDADYKNANNYGYSNVNDALADLKAKNVSLSIISNTSYQSYYSNLYDNTNGIFCNIYGDFADELLTLASHVKTTTVNPIVNSPEEAVLRLKSEYVTDVTIDLTDGTEVSEETQKKLYRLIQGTDRVLTFRFFDAENHLLYSWQFKGSDIINPDQVISFHIVIDANNPEVLKFFPDDVKQIDFTFAHDGALPGMATITITTLNQVDPDGLYLYHYVPEEDGLELIHSNVPMEGEYAIFTLNHCSDYILSNAFIRSLIPDKGNDLGSDDINSSTTDSSTMSASVSGSTGDPNQIGLLAVMLIASIIAMGSIWIVILRKRNY